MNIREKLTNYVARRRAMRELNAMDARMLDDLGISRSDIVNVVGRRF